MKVTQYVGLMLNGLKADKSPNFYTISLSNPDEKQYYAGVLVWSEVSFLSPDGTDFVKMTIEEIQARIKEKEAAHWEEVRKLQGQINNLLALEAPTTGGQS